MEQIKKVQKEYNRLKPLCSNNNEAIKEALLIVYRNSTISPHIYKDSYEDFSYVYIDGCMLNYSGDIYIKLVEEPEEENPYKDNIPRIDL